MGDWNINIQGIGAHHNGQPYDAEAIMAEFVAELKRNGHCLLHVDLTYGGSQNVLNK